MLWLFTKDGSTVQQQVTSGGYVTDDFSGLFTIVADSKYDLMATNTTNTDPYCGFYQ